MSRRAWAYICTILFTGAVLTALAFASLAQTQQTQQQWLVFAALTTLATLAQLFKAEAPNHVLFYATPVFIFAGVPLLHPFLIVALIAIPHAVEWARERWIRSTYLRAWYLQPFNIAMNSIAGLCAHSVYTALTSSVARGPALSDVPAVTLTAVVFLAVNHTLLGMALVLARRVSWRDSGVLDSESLLSDMVLLCLGAVVAVLWRINPWMIAWALSPLILMYRALMIPQLRQDAQIDGKTGLCNARHFNTLFAAELDRARRFDRPLALIIADLDHFKKVNDTYGHLAGDTVLASIGQIIRSTSREYDIAGRFGGEEFALVLPEVDLPEAQALAERLRLTVETASFGIETKSTPVHITMSFGVACFPDDAATLTELTHAADLALYQAKAGGRNRVVCAADVPRSSLSDAALAAAHAAASTAHNDTTAPEAADGRSGGTTDAPAPATRHAAPERAELRPGAVPPARSFPQGVLWLFVSAVIAAGAATAVLGTMLEPTRQLPIIGLLTGLAVLAELLQVDLYGRGTVSVSVGLAFGAALITGIPGLACVSAGIALAHHFRQRRRIAHLERVAFNWATHVLAGLPPVVIMKADGTALDVKNLLLLALPATIAALVYYAVETGLVATVLSITEGIHLLPTWRAQYRWLAGHYLVLCLMGLVLGIAYSQLGLAGILVYTLPVVMMHYVQKQYIVRTKESMQELTRLNRDLTRAALTDHLTGLGNQRAFQEELHRAIARVVRHDEQLVLVRIDLDEFKVINEQLGPRHGDRILAELAAVLRERRATDPAFRLGGDEFALLMPHTTSTDAMTAMERLRQEAQQRLEGATVSIGIATVTPEEQDADLLHEQADAALDAAKRRGRNTVVTFEEIRDTTAITSSAQALAMRRLLAEPHVRVAFQPIWDLRKNRILAFEALTRPSPEYGFAGPQEAFDIAERIGHAHDLDAICREAILARAAELPSDALLFLNMSPQTLDHDRLAGTALVDAVAAAGLTPDRVVLELTERSMARLQVVVREAKRLRQLGFRLALDDTGAGNAGLEMLSQLPVDFVKIDRGVVVRALDDKAARGVLAGIIAIARETNTYVIAEGIEDAAMLDLVRWAGGPAELSTWSGVQGVQGYLLGRPSETIADFASLKEQLAAVHAA